MPNPELEIRCKDSDPDFTRMHVRGFLSHYVLHTEGPYAIDVKHIPGAGEGYGFTIFLSPVENSRISAIIPIQGAELGRFTGGVFERDTPRQIGITCGNVQYVVYENPQQAEQPTTNKTRYTLDPEHSESDKRLVRGMSRFLVPADPFDPEQE